MSVILVDLANEDHYIQLSNWHWQPIVDLINKSDAMVDDIRLEMLRAKLSVDISQNEARAIASYLEPLVTKLNPDKVVKQDGTVEPGGPAAASLNNLTSPEWDNLYETNLESLQNLIAFCRTCSGFKTS